MRDIERSSIRASRLGEVVGKRVDEFQVLAGDGVIELEPVRVQELALEPEVGLQLARTVELVADARVAM